MTNDYIILLVPLSIAMGCIVGWATAGLSKTRLGKRIGCLFGRHEYNTAEWKMKKLDAGYYKVYQECANCNKAHYVTIYVEDPGEVEIWEN